MMQIGGSGGGALRQLPTLSCKPPGFCVAVCGGPGEAGGGPGEAGGGRGGGRGRPGEAGGEDGPLTAPARRGRGRRSPLDYE